jgi:type II secretory pathway component PulF
MVFGRQLPLSALIELCRVLRHSLDAGLTLREVFARQAERGCRSVRPVASRIRQALDRGDSLSAALDRERDTLPALFLSMAGVGEETGHLPEIFGELERYYRLEQRLGRQFRRRMMVPVFQFILAVVVIAVLLFVLGAIQGGRGRDTPAVLDVRGPESAWRFLGWTAGIVILLVALCLAFSRIRRQLPRLDAFLLRVPRLGPCLEALALSRFALALQLTLDSSLSIARAVSLSLSATGNAAYTARTEAVVDWLKKGNELTLALAQAGAFPQAFLDMVAVGEEGGRVPEIMRHQARYYGEEAERRMTGLVRMLNAAVWLAYVIFMVAAIMRIAGAR